MSNTDTIEITEFDSLVASSTPRRVLFVCTGNTCRSPMAEAYLRQVGRPFGIDAFSAGMAANVGEPIASNAVRALKNRGITPTPDNPFESHTAIQLTSDMVDAADVVVCMNERAEMTLIMAFPENASKIRQFPTAIPDPYGGDLAEYERTLGAMVEGICEMFAIVGDGK